MILAQLLAATALVVIGAQDQPNNPVSIGADKTEITKADAEAMIAKCSTRRFVTSAEVPANGKLRRTRITLCAADSDTGAEWIAKLEKAAASIESQPNLPEAAKLKLLDDLRQEIARLKSAPAPGLEKPQATPIPQAQTPLLETSTPVGVSSASSAASKSAVVPAAPTGAKPRPKLTAACVVPGKSMSERCGVMAPRERLEIRAENDFNAAVTLLFRRAGNRLFGSSSNKEAEVELTDRGMRRGQTVRLRVPNRICSGALRAKFEIEVRTKDARASTQAVNILGPFETRCDT